MTREPIYSALFALLSGLPGIVYASRRLKAFSDMGTGDQPALFMEQKHETSEIVTKQPQRWLLNVDLLLYVHTGGMDSSVIPAMILNPILDTVCNALIPPERVGEQTLGGLVQRCRVKGDIQVVEGVQGDQAFAIIPVEILVV